MFKYFENSFFPPLPEKELFWTCPVSLQQLHVYPRPSAAHIEIVQVRSECYLSRSHFGPQLVNAAPHPLSIFLPLIPLPLQLFILPLQLSHSFLQFFFLTFQQLEESVCTFHRLQRRT